jgi:uncharacterized protein YjbI with pentapeptide repeats
VPEILQGLRGLLFEDIDFSEAGFDDAMLAFSVFRNCILDGATFDNAHACEFIGCRMTGAGPIRQLRLAGRSPALVWTLDSGRPP